MSSTVEGAPLLFSQPWNQIFCKSGNEHSPIRHRGRWVKSPQAPLCKLLSRSWQIPVSAKDAVDCKHCQAVRIRPGSSTVTMFHVIMSWHLIPVSTWISTCCCPVCSRHRRGDYLWSEHRNPTIGGRAASPSARLASQQEHLCLLPRRPAPGSPLLLGVSDVPVPQVDNVSNFFCLGRFACTVHSCFDTATLLWSH